MLTKNEFSVTFSAIADYFIEPALKDFNITKLSTLDNPSSNTVLFVKELTEDVKERISSLRDCVIFLDKESSDKLNIEDIVMHNFVVQTLNPRMDFIKFANYLSDRISDFFKEIKYAFVNGSWISNEAQIGKRVTIEPGCFIGHNSSIGDETYIKSGVIISNNVVIGKKCLIGYNSVVGGHGFGGERDIDGFIYMMPHVGGVIIDDYVYLGSFVTVVAGTIDPTVIKKHTKIDDHVHIAHNCKIGESCFITACAQLGGSDKVGERVWIGPNASIMQNIQLGDSSIIGLGAVVTKSVLENITVLGNPAENITNYFKKKMKIQLLLEQHQNQKNEKA